VLPLLFGLAIGAGPSRDARPAPPAEHPQTGGFNVIQAENAPFGSDAALHSFEALAATGAGTVALIPFLWQPDAASGAIQLGSAVSDDQLLAGIREAKVQGLEVLLKPHVWVPGTWAGAIAPADAAALDQWFDGYTAAIVHYAALADRAGVDALAIGTELVQVAASPRWPAIIAAVRSVFRGRLTYVAHGLEGARRFPYWPLLDFVSLSLYPKLGADSSPTTLVAEMAPIAEEIEALGDTLGKPVWVAEVGLMSAEGAQAEPWLSPEQRGGPAAPALQARVLRLWLETLARPGITHVLVWRWLTDPGAGGLDDLDFTVQNKPAERMLRCFWAAHCDAPAAPAPTEPGSPGPAAAPTLAKEKEPDVTPGR